MVWVGWLLVLLGVLLCLAVVGGFLYCSFWGLYNIVLLVGCVMDAVMFELIRGGVQLVFLFFGFSGLGS